MPVAVLIDTISIQNYIFGSNKLKENIGGSYIIENLVYRKMIPEGLAVANIANEIDLFNWVNAPAEYRLEKYLDEKVEIGYIGGGNALLIFRNRSDADAFIKSYSRLILAHFPGIKLAFGLHDGFDYREGEEYKRHQRGLHKSLIQNRNFSTVQVLPLKHGIVEDCPWTNEAQETIDIQSRSFISKMAQSRVGFVKDAHNSLKEKFSAQIREDFTFTDELERFGQPDDKGYIAIVHADGNGMGQRFIACNSLAETRKLSAGVAKFADKVMEKLISYLVERFSQNGPLADWELDLEGERRILPIRPLILGGDDITFVCEGRLGVHLAEKLLEYMAETPINEKHISACAGVAIVHTKYPFYKAYQLAEDLIGRAKKASREHNDSWLDYMISTGGFSGSLDEIIKDQFTVAGKGTLKNGPYCVDRGDSSMKALLEGMIRFQKGSGGYEKWPRNKIKDLRDALRRDEAYQTYFLNELQARGLKLPNGKEKLWDGDKTPYYDMIELLDFYPESLLL
ncbi:MAG: hypothetical protein KIS77_22405 [Saprospiraceae bacterium]|nr:hypothetical protein [Saprospiraceae bacterium]